MNILVVEDEPRVAGVIVRCLEEEGHRVRLASSGPEAIGLLDELSLDAAILDVMLPGVDGFEVCRAIRKQVPQAGVIMLSAKGAVDDRIRGLASGADDYLAKPFAIAELVLRLQALERRLNAPLAAGASMAGWSLDPLRHELTIGGHKLSLSPREAALMHVFLRHPGIPLSRARLADEAWNVAFDTGTNQVDVYVNHLRRKLELVRCGDAIETERGLGYRFSPQTNAGHRT